MAWKHGASGYRTYRCRCAICTKANTDRARKEREDRAGRTPKVHNASTYANWGCRCQTCSEDWSTKLRARRGSKGVHGLAGYAAGCRCSACRRAQANADLRDARSATRADTQR